MNKVQLVGRVVRDIETRYTTGENAMAVARFAVAVNRRMKNSEGGYDADFPSCVAFGRTAEFLEKYFHKGDMIGLTGRLTTGSYTNKDGNKVYTTDVVVEEVEFVGGKSSNSGETTTTRPAGNNGGQRDTSFMNIPESTDTEELPF